MGNGAGYKGIESVREPQAPKRSPYESRYTSVDVLSPWASQIAGIAGTFDRE